MDFGLAFSYMFQDPDWAKKIGITALISLIPVIGQVFLLGWGADITRRVIDHETGYLPDVDFANQLARGFQVLIATIAYIFPIFVLSLVVAALTGGLSAADNGNLSALAALIGFLFSLVCMVYGLAIAFFMPAAIGNYAAKDIPGAVFHLKEIFALVKAAPAAYLIAFLGSLVAGLIAPLGTILCFVGVVLTSTYEYAVVSHLYGQAYGQATAKQAAATPATFTLPQ
jgi:xanthosine utilization system XapX-like protein